MIPARPPRPQLLPGTRMRRTLMLFPLAVSACVRVRVRVCVGSVYEYTHATSSHPNASPHHQNHLTASLTHHTCTTPPLSIHPRLATPSPHRPRDVADGGSQHHHLPVHPLYLQLNVQEPAARVFLQGGPTANPLRRKEGEIFYCFRVDFLELLVLIDS